MSSTQQTSRKGVSSRSPSDAPRNQAGDGSAVATASQELKPEAAEHGEPPAAEQSGGADNVDRIREILFGGQMRDYERKFARLEERFIKESTDLRADVKRSLEALEVYVGKEVDSLAERLHAEQAERATAVKELGSDLKVLTQSLEKRAAQLDEQIAKGQRELRQRIFEESKSTSEEIRRSAEDLTAVVTRESQELREDKADRAALSSLFTELALRLSGEFQLPEGGDVSD